MEITHCLLVGADGRKNANFLRVYPICFLRSIKERLRCGGSCISVWQDTSPYLNVYIHTTKYIQLWYIIYIYIFRYKLWHIDACRHDTYYLYTTMCSRLYIPTSKEQSLTANDPPHPLCLPPMPPLRSSMMLVNSGIISYHQMDIARILVIYTPAHPKNGNHLYYQIYMYIYILLIIVYLKMHLTFL